MHPKVPLYLGILTQTVTNMKKIYRNTTNAKKYKDAPQTNIDELAEKWVEMMVGLLLSKDKKGLQKSDKFPKLNPA